MEATDSTAIRIIRSPYSEIDISGATLADFVLDSSRGQPEQIALVDGSTGRTLTLEDLRREVARVAAGLAELGIGKGDVVAVWAPNSPDFAVAILAVVRLGAIVTSANTAYTSKELSFQLKDARARLVITCSALLPTARAAIQDLVPAPQIITTDLADGCDSLASIARNTDPPDVAIDPARDIAFLPYSSGTTGLPKGVMLTHRNLVANLQQIDTVECDHYETAIGLLPFYHVYGLVVVLLSGIKRGTTIVTLPRFELESFLKTLQGWNIEAAHVVPPIVLALAKHPLVDNYSLPRLKTLFSGAAPLGTELSDSAQKRFNVEVRQGYGMTECSPVAFLTRPGTNRSGKSGQLAPNTECRIVDPQTGHDADAGERGEIWIRGPQVMPGYLGNPQASAQTVDAQGWLHTGDIGFLDADGYLAVVDRLKELIKVKGFQVPPAELEALLLQHPLVADAAVIPVPDGEAGEVPKALVVARGTVTSEEILEFVNRTVAYYKRIKQVEFIASIPKSPSGKILRRVLVDRERAGR